MTRPSLLAITLAALSCAKVNATLIEHSGAVSTPGPCVAGSQRCAGDVLLTCGHDRQWPLTPAGTACRTRCVADPLPRCAGPALDASAPSPDASEDALVLPVVAPEADAEVADGE